MHKIQKYFLYGATPLSLVALLVFMMTTNPINAGPTGILIVLSLFYILTLGILFNVLKLIITVKKRVSSKPSYGTNKYYYAVSIVALWPLFLLAINTLGQLTLREVLLVSLLVVIAAIYAIRK